MNVKGAARLYMVRHGETLWNIEDRIQGQADSLLSDNGREQARKLAGRLSTVRFDAVYSSSSSRAVQTARILAGGDSNPIRTDPDLREIDLGPWQGILAAEVQGSAAYREYRDNPADYRPPIGESLYAVQNRMLAALGRIADSHAGQRVLVVSHGVALRTALLAFRKGSIKDIWSLADLAQTSLSIVAMAGGKTEIQLYGDTSHL